MRNAGRASVSPYASPPGDSTQPAPRPLRWPLHWWLWLLRRLGLRRPRSRTLLRPQGWYCLGVMSAVWIVALSRQMNLAFILAGMLLAVLWFNWRWASRIVSRLEPQRQLPESVCAGDLLLVRVSLTNRKRRTAVWAVRVQDTIRLEQPVGKTVQPIDPAVLFVHVPAGQCSTAVYRGRLLRRGRYRFGPLRIATQFPFGLLERRVTIPQSDTLYVYPKLGRLTQHWFARRQHHFEGTGHRERCAQRTPGEFYGVRDWQHGDSRRWIHWRSTARHGTLVVRQFEQPRNPDVVLILDLCQPALHCDQPEHLVERAVAFVATVVADLCRTGGAHLVVTVGGGQPECIAGPTSPALLQTVMKALAVAEPSSDSRWVALLHEAVGRASPGSQVILVSTADLTAQQCAEHVRNSRQLGGMNLLRRMQVIGTAAQLDHYFVWR